MVHSHRPRSLRAALPACATALGGILASFLWQDAARADYFYGICFQASAATSCANAELWEFNSDTGLNARVQGFPLEIRDLSGTSVVGSLGNTSLGNNSFAYDPVGNVFYWIGVPAALSTTDPANYRIFAWNRTDPYVKELGAPGVLQPANAGYARDTQTFYFIKDKTWELVSYNVDYTTGITALTPSVISPAGGTTAIPASLNGFGDIAPVADGSLIYGSNTNKDFFVIDTAASTYTNLGQTLATGRFQLAFNADYSKLYGYANDQAKWYEVNTATGAGTEVAGQQASNVVQYSDVGGAAFTPADVPSPLPAFGAAATFAWSRRLRRRIAAR